VDPLEKSILSRIPFKNQTADEVQRKNVTAERHTPSSVTYRVVSGSWFRASTMTTVNKNQPDAQ
jgi:hypothetical protein